MKIILNKLEESLIILASPVAQVVKNLAAMQETPVRFLGWEDPLEKGMATHFSILAWEIVQTEEPGGLQTMGHKDLDVAQRPALPLQPVKSI